MSKLHRDNAGYVGCSYEDTQDPYYSYNKLSLPLSGATETVQRPAEVTHTVTVAGGKFVIGGVSQATLSLIEGGTYKFDQSDSSNSTHPFKFSQTSDGTHNRGTEYTKGVTYVGTPGSSGAYTQLVVPFGGLDLYYYCGNHSGMGGSASTPANAGMFTAALPILKTTDQFGATLATAVVSGTFSQAPASQTSLPVYSNQSGTGIGGGGAVSAGFDGSTTTFADMTHLTGQWSKLTFGSSISGVTSLVVGYDGEGDVGYNGSVVNSSVGFNGSRQTITLYSGTAITLDDLYFVSQAGNGVCRLYDVYINGVEQTFSSSTPVAPDPFAANLVLALPMNGSNGGTTFTDQSAAIRGTGSAKTINRNGNTQTSTAQSFFYGSSAEFDGTDDNLKLPVSSDFQFGSGDFTIETWFRPDTTSRMAIYHGSSGTDWSVGIDYSYITQTIAIWASSNGTSWNLADGDSSGNRGTTVVPVGAWTHIAYVRDGGRLLLFVNGNLDKEFSVSGSIVDRSSAQPVIGEWHNSTYDLNGYLADFRIYKGVAKYRPEESGDLGFQALSYLGDGGTQKIGGPVYTDQISGTQFSGSYSKDKAFDGNLDNRTFAAVGTANLVFTPDPAIKVSSSLRLRIKADSTGNSGALSVNGVDYSSSIQSNSNWLTIPNVTSLTSISFGKSTGSGHEMSSLAAIEVDGVILRNGNGSNIPFKPDFVWLKNDGSTTGHHCLYDSVRGVYKHIQTSSTATEYTENTGRGLSSFNSDGFTLDTSNGEHVGEGNINVSGQRYSAYAWKAGGAATTITAGSLNSSAYDQSQTWSNLVTGTLDTTYGNSSPAAPFQGTTGSSYSDGIRPTSGNYLSINFGTTFASATTVRIYGHASLDGASYTGANENLKINGTALTAAEWANNGGGTGSGQQNATFTLSSGLTSLEWGYSSGSQSTGYLYLQAIEVDGKLLTNSGVTPPNVPSIASVVSASSEYGFSIVKYSPASSTETLAHSLGNAPRLILVKRTDQNASWSVFHADAGPGMVAELNGQGKPVASLSAWSNTSPTSYVFSIGNYPDTGVIGADYIAYLFADKTGYQKISSYTGTGASGNVVTTGFRPSFLLIKADIDGEDWIIMDDARTPVNPVNDAFFANTGQVPNATSVYSVDFNDDGFTINNTNPRFNTDTKTYYYMAIGGRKPSDPGQDAFKFLDTLNTKDQSSSAHTITNSDASFQTSVKKFYDGAAYFNNTSSYVRPADSTDFAFGTGDFTAECWIYTLAHKNYIAYLDTRESGQTTDLGWVIASNASGALYVYSNAFLCNGSLNLNQWTHVAYCRSGGTHTLYINGSPAQSSTTARNYTDDKLTIGATSYGPTEWQNGYIQDVRIYKGIAKYTSSFSPPERSLQGTARRYPSGIYVVS